MDVKQDDGGERSLCSTGESVTFEKKVIVPNATINMDWGTVSSAGGEGSAPAEKTQFDVILKSAGGAKVKRAGGDENGTILSDQNGEFTAILTDEELKKLPEYFYILFTITPPEDFKEPIKVKNNMIQFYKYKDISEFKFKLMYSNGYFAVYPVDQLNKITVHSSGGAKKALDAFINATTKAVVSNKSEPVTGVVTTGEEMEIVGLGFEKKKTVYISSDKSQTTTDAIIHCLEFNVKDTFKTITDSDGYFTIKANKNSEMTVLFTFLPPENFANPYLTGSMIVTLPAIEEDVYELMLTYEKSDRPEIGGKFIIIHPIPYAPCSPENNPMCKPTKCKIVGGTVGKCQYLYDNTTGEYKCGCAPELCNADCTGNCKMPNGGEGICHIEEISANINGAEIINKQCVCGPINVGCNMDCADNQDCINQTAGQFPLCRTDMFGNSFCTQTCTNADECKDPFSMCVKMGDERGICICPCVNADNIQAQCNPIGMYNQHCNNVTFGTLTDCIDIDNNGSGECSLCCQEDKDCPEGLHCYDLTIPLNDKCKKACMCKETPPQNLCKECSSDFDCGSGESCVDEDNNPNTPKVCTVPCGPLGTCPTSPVYTYCDYNVSKYCICRHPEIKVDCNYICTDNQDCITNSNGAFDICMPDMNGIKRCTKGCTDAKECPSPYSMCIQFGDKSYCACPCIHFDTDNVSCYTYGFNNPICMTKTNNSLPDCFDVDNDGVGECTDCCNSNSDCPENMICTPVLNAKCDKVCTCKEHPVADVCQKCSQNSDCPSGFLCADDDNNMNTPNVCTRVCPSVYPCPTSPIYTYCDNNISKYCICNGSGIDLCNTKCESNNDCPQGLICADDDLNPNTPKICTKTCSDGCPPPMICNNDANLPMAICMCVRDFCKTCKSDNDCTNGLKCIDSDGDPLSPNVCTLTCSNDYECPLNLSCNTNTKSCDCNRCSRWSNPKCEPNICYNNGVFGKCEFIKERCDCVTTETPNICKECKEDIDCTPPLKCVDIDYNSNTPKICTEPCSPGSCLSPAICDYNVSKYCFCK